MRRPSPRQRHTRFGALWIGANDFWEEGVVFHDKPVMPFNVPAKKKPRKEKEADSAAYLVFEFGINDPSVPPSLNFTGNHTKSGRALELESESADSLASPLGWHGVPLDVAYPYPIGGDLKSFTGKVGEWVGDTVNYTVTAGNNVSFAIFRLQKSNVWFQAVCHENWGGRSDWIENYRPDAGVSRNFTFKYKPVSPPDDDPSVRQVFFRLHSETADLRMSS